MDRKQFLSLFGTGIFSMTLPLKALSGILSDPKTIPPGKLPVLFIGHGNPMNALEDNDFTRAWKNIGNSVRPRAILCISAHWLTRGTYVTAMDRPKTIHDFYGFPRELMEYEYQAPGSPSDAKNIIEKVNYTQVAEDHDWGLDHGTWSILAKMYPDADIPVFQMSIDIRKPMEYHYELAKELKYLREKGVLIIGSGNIVHNLRMAKFAKDPEPYDWAVEFDELSRKLIESGEHQSLIHYEKLGQAAKLSIPTTDHYIPLIYSLGLQDPKDEISFPVEGMAFGSGSMRSVRIG